VALAVQEQLLKRKQKLTFLSNKISILIKREITAGYFCFTVCAQASTLSVPLSALRTRRVLAIFPVCIYFWRDLRKKSECFAQ